VRSAVRMPFTPGAVPIDANQAQVPVLRRASARRVQPGDRAAGRAVRGLPRRDESHAGAAAREVGCRGRAEDTGTITTTWRGCELVIFVLRCVHGVQLDAAACRRAVAR